MTKHPYRTTDAIEPTTRADAHADLVGSDRDLGIVLVVVGLLGILCGVLHQSNSTEAAIGLLFTAVGLRLLVVR